MLPNFELRFVKREVEGLRLANGYCEMKTAKILQYRVMEEVYQPVEHGAVTFNTLAGYDWSDWQDVPVVEDDNA